MFPPTSLLEPRMRAELSRRNGLLPTKIKIVETPGRATPTSQP